MYDMTEDMKAILDIAQIDSDTEEQALAALSKIRYAAQYSMARKERNYGFCCPECGDKDAFLLETMFCDGVTSEITGIVDSCLRYGESIGHGDVVDITYQCSSCGHEIAFDINNVEGCEFIKFT